MRVIAPTEMLREAAEVMRPMRDHLTVIGALAVQIALDGHDIALTPTRDVDAGTDSEQVARVVHHLEEAGLRRSSLAHERSFTWEREGIKVQLIRPFHPFPKPPATGLPQNNLVAELRRYRWPVVFEEDPGEPRLWAATPAALVALKEAAFGRTRHSGEPVDRDFSDAALLLEYEGELIAKEVAGDGQMRARVLRAAQRLEEEPAATEAAVRELVASRQEETPREAEELVLRAAGEIRAELEPDAGE